MKQHATLRAAVLCLTLGFSQSQTFSQTPASFPDHVAPILLEHCVACHGAKRAEGGYRLDSVEQMLRPGDGANPPVVKSKSAESELVMRVRSHDPEVRMPADAEPLSSEEIELIASWIDQGASLYNVSQTDPLWLIIPPTHYASPPEHYPNAISVTALSFSADGAQLISSGYHEALVWNTLDGALMQRITNQVQRAYSVSLIHQGATLVIAGGTPGAMGETRLVDRVSGGVQQVLSRANEVVLDVAIRPGKNEMAVALADNTIRLIDLDKSEQRRMIASHADWVMQLAYSDDGKRLGSASRDKSAKVYDAETGELIASYPGHAAAVRGIAAIGNGAQWVTVGLDKKWHRWEVDGAKKIAEVVLGGEPSKILKLDTSVVVPCSDKHWYRIDLSNNSIAIKQPGHEDWVVSAAYHSASSRLATGSIDGSIRIWNLVDGTPVKAWVAKP